MRRIVELKSFFAIAAVYTSAVLVWLLATPSLSENPFFLIYSLQRFALIVGVFLFLMGLVIGFFTTRSRFMESLFTRIGGSKSICLLSFLILIVVILVILNQVLGLPETLNTLLFRLFPVFVLFLCVSVEILFYQHIVDNTLLFNSIRFFFSRFKTAIEELNFGYKFNIWNWLIAALIIFVSINLFNSALTQLHLSTTDTWRIGDWLINYQGGFVRRGLLGEILFHISNLTTINNVVLTVALQLILYLVFFISVFQLLKSSSFSVVNFMLVFSPAFLVFTIYNPLGSFRKEIIWFAFFSALCNILLSNKKSIPIGFFVGIGVSASILVLSHEMLVAFLPYLVCATIVHDRDVTSNTRKLILALIPAGVIAGILLIFGKGSPQVVVEICDSLKGIAPSECLTEGAISSLAQSTQSAHAMVLSRIDSSVIAIYLITTLLGLLPLLLFFLSSKFANFFSRKVIRIWFLFFIVSSLLCSLPLFWVAVDYGRFIYIHIVSLSLLTFMINHEKSINEKPITLKLVFPLLVGISFVIIWRLIYAGATMGNVFPWIGLFGFAGLN